MAVSSHSRTITARGADERVGLVASTPFIAVHLAAVATVVVGVDATALIVFAALYWGRMVFITAGYHRYFAHRSYSTSRAFQFVLALGGASAAQKGPLWWAGHHRNHHRYADTPRDIHSPRRGLGWSHAGWILCPKYKSTPTTAIGDFAAYPELVAVDRFQAVVPYVLGVVVFFTAGLPGLLFGFFASTVALWHTTFLVNSLSHRLGRRRYATLDTSRNSAMIAVLTAGEGWHNNHHHYSAAARQGFYWWEIDVTYYLLRVLAMLRIVWDIQEPPGDVLASDRIADGVLDSGMLTEDIARARSRIDVAETTASRRRGAQQRTIRDVRADMEAGADRLGTLMHRGP